MMCRIGADGDPSVAVGAQSGGAMARAPSGRTDHCAAAGGVRTVNRSHKTVAAAMGCDSSDTTAAGMAERTIAARAGSIGNPDTAHLGHGEAAGGTRPVHGILGGAGCSIFLRYVIHLLFTARKHVVHLIGRAEPMDRRSGAGCMRGGSNTGALALQDDPRQLDVGTGEEVEVGLVWRISVPPALGRECPPDDGTQPPCYHRLRLAAHPTARSWMCPPPAAGYPGAASAPSFRRQGHLAVGLSAPSPDWPLLGLCSSRYEDKNR
ncbi:hypothetical protein PIB30_052010 [Stylosanthes scabra]|uniref:Uncharacterized protein n=1 Tax=Stylosanthes scabra TaxID=79078 RepID=A0ABU6WIH5_9FABA|nr:hypothetical protein [Stylosanthes scabra]